jgi:hypothetical protein
MAGSTIVKGAARAVLVEQTAVPLTGSGGVAFGTFNAGLYSRITGLVGNISSVTVRVQFGISSAAFQVSSSLVVNSGGGIIDLINYGRYVNLSLSQAGSQTLAGIAFYGEPLR